MRRILHYPTTTQVTMVVDWANLGGQVFTPRHPRSRAAVFLSLRGVIERTALPSEYESMRQEMLRHRMDPAAGRLLPQLLSTLRRFGYLYDAGQGCGDRSTPRYACTPLTGLQLHIVREFAAGMTGAQVAACLGADYRRVSERMSQIKADHGCTTNTQVIATAYAAGWLPTFREHRELMRGAAPPLGNAFRETPVRAAVAS